MDGTMMMLSGARARMVPIQACAHGIGKRRASRIAAIVVDLGIHGQTHDLTLNAGRGDRVHAIRGKRRQLDGAAASAAPPAPLPGVPLLPAQAEEAGRGY
jgi:hypothetical protein